MRLARIALLTLAALTFAVGYQLAGTNQTKSVSTPGGSFRVAKTDQTEGFLAKMAEKFIDSTTESASGPTIGNLGFQGQFTDLDTQLVRAGARIYDPKTGRFLTPDSFPGLVAEPWGLNPYAYANADPVNGWDPGGAYGMDLHFNRTDDWAKSVAAQAGFSANFATLLADNIASFDQYHDKEWTLAPNNYSLGNGQGNALHFQNPNRGQVDYNPNDPNTPALANYSSPTTQASVIRNQYVDPADVSVGDTTIPVYAMKALGDFNSVEGTQQLINDPRVIRDGPALAYLTLDDGTVKDRLEQAVREHDPRLFGIALHEYQDTFAHAGFEKWHGFSTANDMFCGTNDPRPDCAYSTAPDGTPLTPEDRTKQGLYDRDRLMQNGTDYWLEQFMDSQVGYYQGLQQTGSLTWAGKEEKLLEDPIGTIKPEEAVNDKIFALQGAMAGKAPCTDAILKNIIPFLRSHDCNIYLNDFKNQIIR
jgi:RHS repeat-associated protein